MRWIVLGRLRVLGRKVEGWEWVGKVGRERWEGWGIGGRVRMMEDSVSVGWWSGR